MHSGPKVRTGFEKEEVRRFRFEPPDLADLGIKALVADLGTKILVPKKRRAREAEPLGMQGGTGGCRPPAKGSGGLEAPQEQQGVWWAAAPQ